MGDKDKSIGKQRERERRWRFQKIMESECMRGVGRSLFFLLLEMIFDELQPVI
jgi:hypothetical protein